MRAIMQARRSLRAELPSVAVALSGLALVTFGLAACGSDSARVAELEKRVIQLEGRPDIDVGELRLRDSKGKVRARLHLSEAGQPVLRLIDAADQTRAMLRLRDDDTPAVVLWGRDQKGTAFLAIDDKGVPSLLLFDASGTIVFPAGQGRGAAGTPPPARRPAPRAQPDERQRRVPGAMPIEVAPSPYPPAPKLQPYPAPPPSQPTRP